MSKKPKIARQKAKKPKEPKIDGLSAKDVKKLRAATRMVWHWSHPKKLVIARCTGPDGYQYCESSAHRGGPFDKSRRCPKVYVDHIEAVGDLDGGYFERLFTPSKNLQGLCKKCHDKKTREEREWARLMGESL